MKKIIILVVSVLIFGTSCTRYFTPGTYANPRHKFESGNKRYQRKMRRMRMQRECVPIIDPLRMRH